ncbi:hypothetical protein CGCF413_v008995 [Colletotrichum fructicola]|nr:hypothetical protein CGCF413_v008995 [Colletotrichum fructicola]
MSDPLKYTIGWICAIHTEYVAARAFLDVTHEQPDCVAPHDSNEYTLGEMGRHNVVIAVLPDAEYGLSTASAVARSMLSSFPNIRAGLMVGIAGGAPLDLPGRHIRLGDIVVSSPRDGHGGVFQYDFGKTIQGQRFQPTRFLNQPPDVLRAAVAGLKAEIEEEGHDIDREIERVLSRKPKLQKKYSRPPPETDKLFCSHIVRGSSIEMEASEDEILAFRPQRTDEEDSPAIFYGLIASANQLMKDAVIRDELAEEMGILCFEMEFAGLMNHFPCLVIRGICDYSDSHKAKQWQGYAAMTAAAYGKRLVCRLQRNRLENEKPMKDFLLSSFQSMQQEVSAVRIEIDRDQLNKLSIADEAESEVDIRGALEPGQEVYENVLHKVAWDVITMDIKVFLADEMAAIRDKWNKRKHNDPSQQLSSMVDALLSLVDAPPESDLFKLVDDAWWFIKSNEKTIAQYPLQIYWSCLGFAPKEKPAQTGIHIF